MLGPFRISIHAQPTGSLSHVQTRLEGADYATIQLTAQQQVTPMIVSFEEVVQQLECLPRMFVEPDGAFVWTGREKAEAWQLDGCVYDLAGRVIYVDVSGVCPEGQFEQLLSALGWPGAKLVIQLRQQALFLSEQDFRRYAAPRSGK